MKTEILGRACVAIAIQMCLCTWTTAATTTTAEQAAEHSLAEVPAKPVADRDSAFFAVAVQAGMTEVQAAKIATGRAWSKDTKAFAAMVTREHTANNKALSALALRKGVVLPDRIDSLHQRQLDDLQIQDPKRFEATYAAVTVKDHREAIMLFSDAATHAKDIDLRTFAASTLPTLQRHLAMAHRLQLKHH